MRTHHQLIIRACKSKDPFKRLNSILRRYYIPFESGDSRLSQIVNNMLLEVCKEYKLINVEVLHTKLTGWTRQTNNEMLIASLYQIYLEAILFTSNKELTAFGFVVPTKFKRGT